MKLRAAVLPTLALASLKLTKNKVIASANPIVLLIVFIATYFLGF
jgi:hypothetical protein